MAGAEYHDSGDCTTRHVIRPVLFAFFHHGPPELKAYLKEKLGVSVWENSIDTYRGWLEAPPGNKAPNHIILYWWILMFWNRLPQ